jgi:hypothetical protein
LKSAADRGVTGTRNQRQRYRVGLAATGRAITWGAVMTDNDAGRDPGKPPLAEVLREKLAEQKRSLAWVARQLQVPDTTVRTWFDRNRFPEAQLKQLLELIGWRLVDGGLGVYNCRVARPYRASEGPPQSTLAAAFCELDRRWARVRPALERLSGGIELLFRSMDRTSLFVFYSATVSPKEMEDLADQRWPACLSESLLNGGTLVYLRPGEETNKYFYRDWGFRRVLTRDQCEKEVEELRGRVEKWLQDERGEDAGRARALVRQRLLQYYCDDSPFRAAGFTIGMFQHQADGGTICRRMTVRLPGSFGGILYLPEYEVFEYRFSRFVHRVLDEQEPQLRGEDRKALQRVRDLMEARLKPE